MLETERLLLRKPRLEDDLSEFAADDEVQRWTGGPDRRTWETSAFDLAGEHAEVELGWAILSSHCGKGYATEAARAARDWIDRERIVSLIDPANERSIRVARKLGARPGETVETPHGPAVVWVHPR